jgi:hypothetical protein
LTDKSWSQTSERPSTVQAVDSGGVSGIVAEIGEHWHYDI